jgi:hypothetical protein
MAEVHLLLYVMYLPSSTADTGQWSHCIHAKPMIKPTLESRDVN